MSPKELSDIRRKQKVFAYAKKIKNVSKACRYYGISREAFYQWKRAFETYGEKGLINSKPCPENPKLRTPEHIKELILHLRETYHLGQRRIMWYLSHYHDVKISEGVVSNVLKRNGLNRLAKKERKQSPPAIKRYEKQVPSHRIQVDAKFLSFKDPAGKMKKLFQYTAIDDATRARALKVYPKHNQQTAIEFVDYIRGRFPFRIHTIQTNNGHEFQAKFHWHCEDLGIRHVYIKPASLHLNGKVERSHLTDSKEFYQLIDHTDKIDIGQQLEQWEIFYNRHRPMLH